MAFLLMLKQIANTETSPFDEAIKIELFQLFIGVYSLPIELPGTKYYHAVKARKKITRMFTEIIEERRSSPSLHQDMLDHLLRSDEGSKAKITNNEVIDLAIAVMYAGYDSVSMTSMLAVKYLHDHPKALEALRNEHLEIRKGKLPEDAVNWSDYKSMNFTRAVIFETLRISSLVNGVLRKTTQDIEMRGFVIPKGWKIFLYFAEINDDPESSSFNPWKWMYQLRLFLDAENG
ncbi:uncharacterized protein A4U43_C10F3410 [Asparagus officinalis]|uniref:Cytochrome P450 n=1 Tax=Asparagus officinalis TaxID=4686 RepID=A0A5P1E0B7_ASPOF|nr:uncharacterized protein A4U43_C10F3410 [Asparagus officinalis]